jgi:hypothetical protein
MPVEATMVTVEVTMVTVEATMATVEVTMATMATMATALYQALRKTRRMNIMCLTIAIIAMEIATMDTTE